MYAVIRFIIGSSSSSEQNFNFSDDFLLLSADRAVEQLLYGRSEK